MINNFNNIYSRNTTSNYKHKPNAIYSLKQINNNKAKKYNGIKLIKNGLNSINKNNINIIDEFSIIDDNYCLNNKSLLNKCEYDFDTELFNIEGNKLIVNNYKENLKIVLNTIEHNKFIYENKKLFQNNIKENKYFLLKVYSIINIIDLIVENNDVSKLIKIILELYKDLFDYYNNHNSNNETIIGNTNNKSPNNKINVQKLKKSKTKVLSNINNTFNQNVNCVNFNKLKVKNNSCNLNIINKKTNANENILQTTYNKNIKPSKSIEGTNYSTLMTENNINTENKDCFNTVFKKYNNNELLIYNKKKKVSKNISLNKNTFSIENDYNKLRDNSCFNKPIYNTIMSYKSIEIENLTKSKDCVVNNTKNNNNAKKILIDLNVNGFKKNTLNNKKVTFKSNNIKQFSSYNYNLKKENIKNKELNNNHNKNKFIINTIINSGKAFNNSNKIKQSVNANCTKDMLIKKTNNMYKTNSAFNKNRYQENNNKLKTVDCININNTVNENNQDKTNNINKSLIDDIEAMYFEDKVNSRPNSISTKQFKIPKLNFKANKLN